MAARLLLTFLALFTGLAAQIGPAQARVCARASTEIGEVAMPAAAQRGGTLVALTSRPRQNWMPASRAGHSLDPVDRAPPVPTVLQGIDRARE